MFQLIYDFVMRFKFYVLSAVIMLVFLFFTNQGNILSQRKLQSKIEKVNAERQIYLQKILDIQKSENFSSTQAMEKYARENYYMKKEGETVYVIVDPTNKPISVEER